MFDPELLLEALRQEVLRLVALSVCGLLVFAAMVDGRIPGLRFRASPKPEPPLWTLVDVILALMLYPVASLIGQSFFGLLSLAIEGKTFDPDHPTGGVSSYVLLPSMLFAGATLLFFLRSVCRERLGHSWRVLGFQRGDPRNLVGVVISYALLFAPLWLLAFVVRVWLEGFVGSYSAQAPVVSFQVALENGDYPLLGMLVVSAVVVAPICEEVLFRGFFYSMLRSRVGVSGAVFVTSAVFAAYHLNLYSTLPLFVVGAILAWIYERTRSLIFPIVWHAIFNGVTVVLLLSGAAG